MKFWEDFKKSITDNGNNNNIVKSIIDGIDLLLTITESEMINQYHVAKLKQMLSDSEYAFTTLKDLAAIDSELKAKKFEANINRVHKIVSNRIDGKWQGQVLLHLDGLRKSKKMTKKDLAIKAEVSEAYISRLTKSHRNGITLEIFRRLCDALDTNVIAVLSHVKS